MSAEVKRKIEKANEEFLRRMTSGDPVLLPPLVTCMGTFRTGQSCMPARLSIGSR